MGRKTKKNQINKSPSTSPSKESFLTTTEGDAMVLFLSLALAISGLFAALSKISFLWTGLLVTLAWICKTQLSQPISQNWHPLAIKERFYQNWNKKYLITVTFLISPLLYTLIQKWNSEFPFQGDYDHHVYAALAGLQFWKSAYFYVLGSFLIGFITWYFGFKYWSFLPLLALVSCSYFINPPEFYFARYPAGSYFTAAPWMLASEIFGWNAPINGMRLNHFLSVVCWLFLLRPMLIKNSLSFGFIAFGSFLLFQRDILLFFTSSYIEPWSLIFTFTAIELSIKEDSSLWETSVLIMLATIFKEQSIFILPFLWGSFLWRNHFSQMKRHLIIAITSGFPFLLYYIFRKNSKIWRQVEFSSWNEAFSSSRLQNGIHTLINQFSSTGVLFLILFFLVLYFVFKQNKINLKKTSVCLVAASIFQFLFIYFDKLTLPLPFYPRFFFLCFGLIASFYFFLDIPDLHWSKKMKAIFTTVTILAIIPSLYFGLSLVTKEPYYRNSMDEPRAPEYYPIRTLIQKAEHQNLLKKGDSIIFNFPKERFVIQSLKLGYLDLLKKYSFKTTANSFEKPICNCRAAGSHILLPLFFHDSPFTAPQESPSRIKSEALCIENLKINCRQIFEYKLQNNALVGVLGVK